MNKLKSMHWTVSLSRAVFWSVLVCGWTSLSAQPSMKIRMNDNSTMKIKISDIDTIKFGYSIGDTALGGVVFYVDGTGWHGLVAAPADQGTMAWTPGGQTDCNASYDGLYYGSWNTDNIVFRYQQSGTYAAYSCYAKSLSGYTDWYLPSKYELNLLFEQRSVVGGFSNDVYFSSSDNPEWPEEQVWAQYFYDGGYGNGYQFLGSQGQSFRVRAIRAF